MVTSDPAILAVGECVEHRGATYGLVAPSVGHGRASAPSNSPAGLKPPIPAPSPRTKLKVTGIDVFSAGDFSGGEDCEDIVFRDAARGVYKRIIVKEDSIVGAVLYGDTKRRRVVFPDAARRGKHRRHSATP